MALNSYANFYFVPYLEQYHFVFCFLNLSKECIACFITGSVWFASEMKALSDDCERFTSFLPGHIYSSKQGMHLWSWWISFFFLKRNIKWSIGYTFSKWWTNICSGLALNSQICFGFLKTNIFSSKFFMLIMIIVDIFYGMFSKITQNN